MSLIMNDPVEIRLCAADAAMVVHHIEAGEFGQAIHHAKEAEKITHCLMQELELIRLAMLGVDCEIDRVQRNLKHNPPMKPDVAAAILANTSVRIINALGLDRQR